MNRYGWGNMMDDYTYLEGLGRKMGEWGQDIVKGGYNQRKGKQGKASTGRFIDGNEEDSSRPGAIQPSNDINGGKPHSQEDSLHLKGQAPRGTKLSLLQLHLRSLNIRVDFMPEGMEKRRLNQSTWDVKTKSGFLTVELLFHQDESDPSGLGDSKLKPTFSILTHRNALNIPLRDLVINHLLAKSGRSAQAIPSWVWHLIPLPKKGSSEKSSEYASEEDAPELAYFMEQLPPSPSRRMFYMLDPTKPLAELLQEKYFIEWPTIQVYVADQFHGSIVGQELADVPPPAKRRKLDTREGKKLLSGMLGDYASDEEDESASNEESAAIALAQYASEDDGETSLGEK
ncbi:hypothetical protein FRC02_001799 [Tulasnella sp. 418]|nr:hypothetical protein FRC02_001799 [Tulasnella sp. 418]